LHKKVILVIILKLSKLWSFGKMFKIIRALFSFYILFTESKVILKFLPKYIQTERLVAEPLTQEYFGSI